MIFNKGDKVRYTWTTANRGDKGRAPIISAADGVYIGGVGEKSATVRFQRNGVQVTQRVLIEKLTKIEERENEQS